MLKFVFDGLTTKTKFSNVRLIAEVVELVDTLASGASGGNPVEVRVLFSVQLKWPQNTPETHELPSFMLFL